MNEIIVLMYHAIYSNDSEYENILPEDRPYALRADVFELHIHFLLSEKYKILNPNDIEKVLSDSSSQDKYILFTFDDGHEGFYKYAYPALSNRGLSGIFFITTDFIGNKAGFCEWNELKIMSESGMSIQSHGKTHQFFENMSQLESENEFLISKSLIEENTSSKVNAISFPGGRFNMQSIQIGKSIKYTYFFTSNEIINTADNFVKNSCLGRFAIRSNTSELNLLDFICPKFNVRFKRFAFNKIRKMAKSLLGNHVYHFLYKFYNK